MNTTSVATNRFNQQQHGTIFLCQTCTLYCIRLFKNLISRRELGWFAHSVGLAPERALLQPTGRLQGPLRSKPHDVEVKGLLVFFMSKM